MWYENYATVKVCPSSHATYMGIIKNHIDPAVGQIPLTKLTTLDLQKFYRDQLTAFLREAKNTGVFEMYYLEWATGLRRGELLGLKWQDVDFNQGTITVRRQIGRINGVVTEGPLKTQERLPGNPRWGSRFWLCCTVKKRKLPTNMCSPSQTVGLSRRTACAPPSAETGRTSLCALLRLTPHVRYPGIATRSGCKNGVWYAGPFQRGKEDGD